MEYKRYAPLVGKVLTWEDLDALIKNIREDIVREQRPRPVRRRRVPPENCIHPETDGA